MKLVFCTTAGRAVLLALALDSVVLFRGRRGLHLHVAALTFQSWMKERGTSKWNSAAFLSRKADRCSTFARERCVQHRIGKRRPSVVSISSIVAAQLGSLQYQTAGMRRIAATSDH